MPLANDRFASLEDRGVGVGYMVTTAMNRPRDTDLMAYSRDPRSASSSFIGGVCEHQGVSEACKAARAAGKPVIALKLGASEAAAPRDGPYRALAARSRRSMRSRPRGRDPGARPDELIETTGVSSTRSARSNRLAGVSLSGRKRGLLIDAFHSAG